MSTLHHGDCVEVLRELAAGSVDAVVTDPPYGLEFMGKEWDRLRAESLGALSERHPDAQGKSVSPFYRPGWGNNEKQASSRESQAWHEAWAREAFRVLKPGGHLLAFGGTRTYHRLACAVEDAGFEIRDTICWLYGSGFPKSLDVSKAIDRQAGAEREIVTERRQGLPTTRIGSTTAGGSHGGQSGGFNMTEHRNVTAPATDDARRWQGWGTALKPAHEPIVVARKPLAGTVAANVLEHGVGALNVDGCRIDTGDEVISTPQSDPAARVGTVGKAHTYSRIDREDLNARQRAASERANAMGRWPANVVLDEQAAAMLDEQTGELVSGVYTGKRNQPKSKNAYGSWELRDEDPATYGDSGGASRFFYVAKASRAERNAGLDGFDAKNLAGHNKWTDVDYRRGDGEVTAEPQRNHHPTVKPVQLMRWLVRLVTPPGGTVLDPFLGSGTTGIAAAIEGFRFIGIEREPDYLEIARARIAFWVEHGEDGLRIVAERDQAEASRAAIADAGQLDILSLLDEGAAA